MNRSTQEFYYDQNEDDRFFAELQKQILILTADDNDDDYDISHGRCKIIKSRLRGANGSRNYYDWTKNEKIYVSTSVPSYILNLWRNGNAVGTGVFIPDIVTSRKRNKQRRRKNDKGYMKPIENQQKALSPHNHGC